MASQLCNPCKRFLQPETIPPGRLPRFSSEKNYFVEDSANDGCTLCFLFLSQLSKEQKAMLRRHREEEQLLPLAQRRYETYLALDTTWISMRHHNTPKMKEIPDDKQTFGLSLELKQEKDACSLDTVISSSTTSSNQTVKLIKQWIHTCDESHKCFPVRDASYELPTRILNVGSEAASAVFLVEGKSEAGLYASLSHCWGNHLPIRLLESNMGDLMATGIPFEMFPKTFQDAIEVTRSLGLLYLWIDSLCIVQDSVEDWVKESATMYKVYANATINIAAAFANDSRGGLFATRDKRIVEPCCLEIDYSLEEIDYSLEEINYSLEEISGRLEDDDRGVGDDRIQRKLVAFHDFLWRENVIKSALNQRAWVCQERLLSARTIHFGSGQVFWECCDKIACERFPNGFPELPFNYTPPMPKEVHKLLIQGDIHGGELQASADERSNRIDPIWTVWWDVIEDFSARKLTFGRDKLVAISALAGLFRPFIEGECRYAAGLWRKQLELHLLWEVPGEKPASRQDNYRAPTWSWASTDGPIVYWRSFVTDPFPGMIDIEEIEIDLASSDPFGSVRYGSIKIACRLARVRCYHVDTSSDNVPKYILGIGIGDYGSEMAFSKDVTVDENGSVIVGSWEDLVFVPVAMRKGKDADAPDATELSRKTHLSGLILEAVEGQKSMFLRFGLGCHYYTADEMGSLEKAFQDFDKDAEQAGFDLVRTDDGVSMYSITII